MYILERLSKFRFTSKFTPQKPKTGREKFEFLSGEDAWEKWCTLFPNETFAVEPKVDGMRHIIKIDLRGDEPKVKILTEDEQRDRAFLYPHCIKEIVKALRRKKIDRVILDGEMVEYQTEGKEVNNMQKLFPQLPREDLIPWITSKDKNIEKDGKVVRVLDDRFVVFNLYDILWVGDEPLVDYPYSERKETLDSLLNWDKLIHWKPVPTKWCRTRREVLDAVLWARTLKNSEGAMLKVGSAPYEWKKGRTKYLCKIKNFKELDVIVLDMHKVKGTKNTYNLICGVEVPKDRLEEVNPKKLVEYNGKNYMVIGTTYNVKGDFKKGDVVTVRFIRLRRYSQDGTYHLTWMFPQFVSKKVGKDVDTLDFALEIEKIGTGYFEKKREEQSEELPLCIYWMNPRICPLRTRIYLPPEKRRELYQEMLRLRFPVACELAGIYRCPYLKPYYYSEEELQRARYARYPEPTSKRRYVIQNHWRGRSLHGDLRFEMNGYLLGYTLLYQPKDTPVVDTLEDARKWWSRHREDIKFLPEKAGKGIRVEQKSLQPKAWLTFEAVTPRGSVGATKENEGVLHIIDRGHYWEGWRTPYFQEWFLKSDVDNGIFPKDRWTRVIFRWVRVPKIDPKTKKPIEGKYEYMIRGMIPKDQTPYILSRRARKKGVVPPRGVIPFPVDLVEEYADKVLDWILWMNDGDIAGQRKMKYKDYELKLLKKIGRILKREIEDEEKRELVLQWIEKGYPMAKWKEYPKGKIVEELSEKTVRYTLHFLYWKGQKVIRDMPRMHWYLRIDDKGRGEIRSFYLDDDPRFFDLVAGFSEGRVSRKWLDFEGELPPMTEYNPNKRIPAYMKILSTGKAKYTTETDDEGREIITIEFTSGTLKGKKWKLVQEDKKSEYYTLVVESEEMTKYNFKLDMHRIEGRVHYDIRILKGKYLEEYNLPDNPVNLEVEEWIPANRKVCTDLTWFDIFPKWTTKYVGNLETEVKTIDYGTVEEIETNPAFTSYIFSGKRLRGYFVAKLGEDGWEFTRGRLPERMTKSNPLEGKPLSPFRESRVPKHPNWTMLEIYDVRDFTRCEPSTRVKDYLPDLEIPEGIVDIGICLYQVPDRIHHARVSYVIFDNTKITREEVEKWIRENKLDEWVSPMIRRKR